MADRSTAAVGVANEGDEVSPVAQQGGATPDGTTTDDQTSGTADDDSAQEQPADPEQGRESVNGATHDTARARARSAAQDTMPIAAASEVEQPDEPDRPDGKVGAAAADDTKAGGTTADDVKAAAKARAAKAEAKLREARADGVRADAAKSREAKATGARTAGAKAAPAAVSEPVEPVVATAATVAVDAVGEAAKTLAEAPSAKESTRTPDAKAHAAKRPAQAPGAKTPARTAETPAKTAETLAKTDIPAPDLHSGHRLAERYQLAECVTRVDGFSSWRAVDEKLRRAVGVHVLPADHPQARPVLAAARSAALLGDARFVQVLDAVEDDNLVYVIHEWLPDASSLADLLAAGPLAPHEAYQMVSQVSQGMAAAHREGLAHLRLDPGAVLRTVSGQYRIRGLAVAAALRGLNSDRPQRKDTEAIGALLYASLTQRWPYEDDAHGLAGLPKGVGLIAPDQVRAGIHRGLSEVAMRALANDGATASREEPPCTTPEEVAKAVAGIPHIRPPEQAPPAYRVPAFQQPPKPPGGATRQPVAPPPPAPPPALPGRTGQALKWAVAALVIVAIGLGSWQLADTLQSRDNHTAAPTPTGQKGGQDPTRPPAVKPIKIVGDKDFDPYGDDGSENPSQIKLAYDGKPSTFWQTSYYYGADFGNLKPGVGLIVDLGSARNVAHVKVDFIGTTSVELMAAPAGTTAMPTALSGFTKVASGKGTEVTLTPGSKVTSRYLLVWLTRLPVTSAGNYRGKVSEIHVTG